MLEPLTKTGADKARGMGNSDQMQPLLDPLVAQPTMPVLNVGKWDTSLKIVHNVAKDALEQISLTSTMNLTPMRNLNLLIRSPKSETNSTQ